MAGENILHTPGIYYTISYWIYAVLYLCFLEKRYDAKKTIGLEILYFGLLGAFMYMTDGVMGWAFALSILMIFVILMLMTYTVGRVDLKKAAYYCMRIYALAEFAAALEWQLYYYTVTRLKLDHGLMTIILLMLLTHGIVFSVAFLLEKTYGGDSASLVIDGRRLTGTAFIALMTFLLSNISFVLRNSPFSSTFPSEIFILRTMTDLAGVGMLFANHVLMHEVDTRLEVDTLQRMLEMQYSSYQMAEESVALVNQKYHDLKHQIAILKSEIGSEEKTKYLTQMEQEIRQFEALNRTGNHFLDTILMTKSILCQKEGIHMTTVADGSALDFMDVMDLSALFGNTLDNAIEGVRALSDPDERLIHLTVSRQKGFLRILVENRYEGNIQFQNGLPLTSKKDVRNHGFGVKSIKNIAEKYGGSVRISAENGWFQVGILIPVKGQEKPTT